MGELALQREKEQREPLLNEDAAFITYDDDEFELRKRRETRKGRLCFGVLCSLVVIVAVAMGLYAIATVVSNKDEDSGSLLGKYKHAAVAADSKLCSEVGRDILEKKNGSVVDATIASLLCTGVLSAQSMGIGGGFFMTIYDKKSGKVTIIDSREVAPLNATEDMFHDDPSLSVKGGLAIAVPGEISGYQMAHQLFGRLPWKDLFVPVINITENGFIIPRSLGEALQKSKETIMEDKNFREAYVKPDTGQLYKEGDLLKLPRLAKTFKTIATEGAETYYTGSLSRDVLADLKERGSIVTAEDLRTYKPKIRNATEATLNDGIRLYSVPPPGSGPLVAFILNILEGYKLTPSSIHGNKAKTLTYHRITEAFKFAYAKRTDLGDEDFVNVTELVANLTSKAYADYIRSLIWDNSTHGLEYYGPTFYDQYKTGTAQISAVGPDGSAVSVTSTVNTHFGSKVMGTKTGIIFNNEMDDFSSPNITNYFGVPPSPMNFIKPGKRPLSSMCPTIMLDKNGDVKMVVGGAGGTKITTATVLVAARALWLGENIKQAIDALRIHHQLLPPYIQYEEGTSKTVVRGLSELGHNVTETSVGSSIEMGIVRDGDWLYANSDFRKGGTPAGY
ncbi:hypothetical protein ScPMuIL_003156 [Solemya velum]